MRLDRLDGLIFQIDVLHYCSREGVVAVRPRDAASLPSTHPSLPQLRVADGLGLKFPSRLPRNCHTLG